MSSQPQRNGRRSRITKIYQLHSLTVCNGPCRENDRLAADLERERSRMDEKGDRESHARALREARRNLTELENDLANERDEARQEQAELRRQIVILQKQVRCDVCVYTCVIWIRAHM